MRLKRFAFFLMFMILIGFLCGEGTAIAGPGEPIVRVLLLNQQSTVKITGSMEITGLKVPMIMQGERLFTREEVTDVVHIVADSGFLSVNGQPYRGEIFIKPQADGLMVINKVEMEDYLFGVLACEVNADWPFEMLKAQAVAARCFAWVQSQTKASQDFDLYCDTRSQVYQGMRKEHPRTNEAVKQTRGVVALYQGQVIQAVFSAAAGGQTANSEDVWGKPLPYLRSVPDFDQNCPYTAWKVSVTVQEMTEKFRAHGVDVGILQGLVMVERDASKRVRTIKVVGDRGQALISGTRFRSIFNLKSTNFTIVNPLARLEHQPPLSESTKPTTGTATTGQPENSEGTVTEKGLEQTGTMAETIAVYLFNSSTTTSSGHSTLTSGATLTQPSTSSNNGLSNTVGTDKSLTQEVLITLPLISLEIIGSGFGHGVGLSQWGGKEMAANGATFKEILQYYYQGIVIDRLY